ncbi:diguanylate cyclase [Nocardia thailandica]
MIISEAWRDMIPRRYALVPAAMAGASAAPLLGSRAVSVLLWLAVLAACPIMIVVGIRRYRPAHRVPWYLLTASVALVAVAALVPEWWPGSPHPADELLTLAGYAGATLAAVGWLWPGRGTGGDLSLDSTLIGLSALLASWTFLISPILRAGGDADIAVIAAYPAVLALLLTVLVHALATTGRGEAAQSLLYGALATLLLAGLGTSVTAAGGPDTGPLPSALQQCGYLLTGLAAAHPTMAVLGTPRDIHPERSRRRAGRIAVVLVLVSLAGVIGADLGTIDRIVVSVLLTLLLIGVLVRSERAIADSSRSERRARYQAEHDVLTGLVNRTALLRAPQRRRAEWAGRPLCLLFIDLDGFKAVNDSYGHAVGDELIANAAARIRRAAGPDLVTARYGGDEFVVLGAIHRAEAALLAERLLGAFVRPFELSCGEVPITASIGVATCGGRADASIVYDLLREADSAMYHAKEFGLGVAMHGRTAAPTRRPAVDAAGTAV